MSPSDDSYYAEKAARHAGPSGLLTTLFVAALLTLFAFVVFA